MKPQFKTLPFLFVFAMVSLYSSMTCLRSGKIAATKNPAVDVVVTKADAQPAVVAPVTQETVAFGNTAPVTATPENAKFKSVIGFLQRLREYQLSWAEFPIERPKFLKGIYLTNATAANNKSLGHFVTQSKKHGINALVIDAQGKALSRDQMSLIKSSGIYPIARLVCFDLGLKQKFPELQRVNRIMANIERAAKMGFREIQLDYIRYADRRDMERLPLKFKYEQISSILNRARKLTDSLGLELGADVFGRITLNNNDQIGQKLEIFGNYVHNLYPMVYPSHYYGDPEKIANPYGTVKEGVENSKERIPKTRIIPYIQGFGMKIKPSGLTLPQYVLKQFHAVDDANGDGYVVWNARNDYSATWQAAREYERLQPTRKKPEKKTPG